MTIWQRIAGRRTEFGLLIAATLIIAVTLLNLNLALGMSMEFLQVIGGFIGVFTIAHLALCFLPPKPIKSCCQWAHWLMGWVWP